ncbi:MAG: NAD(P)/FAD-dependent oxidoreductase, partial [Parachlamydiaceae bacterium]
MKIAILGAGFSGLATAWNLLHHTKHLGLNVTLFDPNGIGDGASGIAAGLLHPFGGLHAKLNRHGQEGFLATNQLLSISAEALGFSPFEKTGILRPALAPTQAEDYSTAATKYPQDIQWISQEHMQSLCPGVAKAPGIFIRQGISVYSSNYLNGLWLACQKLGAYLEIQAITQLEELSHFDTVIVTMGAHCTSIKELAHLPLGFTKGQMLKVEWPQDLPPLPTALNSQIYCLMSQDRKSCLVGSTYERQFHSPEPDQKLAEAFLLPKLAELYPPLKGAKVIDCRAGLRVSTR